MYMRTNKSLLILFAGRFGGDGITLSYKFSEL